MKKIQTLFVCFVALIFAVSCSDDGYTDPIESAMQPEDLPWQATTFLDATGVVDKEDFVYETNVETMVGSWGVNEVEYDINILSSTNASNFDKIEFYLTMQEEGGYNYEAPYDYNGALVATQKTWSDSGNFTFVLNADVAYSKFVNKLKFDRSSRKARAGDVFQVYYVIYGKDGAILDSRQETGANKSFSFKVKLVDIAPPVWAGTFTYEWIDATANAEYYGKIKVGDTGTVVITQLEGQTYSMSLNLMFGYFYGTTGVINYDYLSGLVWVTEGKNNEKWNVVKVDGDVLEIALEYKYSAGYNEYCTVRLTRTDGKEWPSTVHTN